MKKVIIIIIVVVLCVAGVGVWYFTKPPEEPKKIFYVPGDFFVTNIKDSKSLLKTTIVLELNKEGMEDYLTENNTIIRDTIVFTLREKTEEELRSSGIQEELRKEIVPKINKNLGIDYLETIYFNDYVIQ